MEEDSVAEVEASEPVFEPSEPVLLKKRGRPKGSLNKKTIAKQLRCGQIAPDPEALPPMVLDVDFTSDEILGENKPVIRKPRAAPKTRDPPAEPPSEEDSPPPPPPTPLPRNKKRPPQEPAPVTVDPPSYLEVLTRGLKEARAKQYAEKVAQYDRFFQW